MLDKMALASRSLSPLTAQLVNDTEPTGQLGLTYAFVTQASSGANPST